ncbi:MAG TPA: hypothetical protein VHB48_03975 [Chitinophagaceae bacterium]|nr:hypothetical protein [Chitinophagaceae bacterium]
MQQFVQKWFRVSLASLALVAFLGCILRYKILFPLPAVNQKYLLHAHSHFAFAGWVTQALMACLVGCLAGSNKQVNIKKYDALLGANIVCAYGMLVSFPFQGYGLFSIIFSTLSIFVSYAFAFVYWRDLNRLPKNPSASWFKAAVLFNAVSSLGAFSLAFMMATKNTHEQWYMAAVYFFLHFQYNGWFFFGCMGLFTQYLSTRGLLQKHWQKTFALFFLAVIPEYFLTVLWMSLPAWLYTIIVCATILQLAGFLFLVLSVKPVLKRLLTGVTVPAKWLAGMSALALSIKLALQALSVIPSLNQLVFGFRPIVIGYLHLVFLGIVSLFLLAYALQNKYLLQSRALVSGLYGFAAGIVVNELLLMAQGLGALWYINIPYINYMLLAAAVIMFLSAFNVAVNEYYIQKKQSLIFISPVK